MANGVVEAAEGAWIVLGKLSPGSAKGISGRLAGRDICIEKVSRSTRD